MDIERASKKTNSGYNCTVCAAEWNREVGDAKKRARVAKFPMERVLCKESEKLQQRW
jgi:hypothetical protein